MEVTPTTTDDQADAVEQGTVVFLKSDAESNSTNDIWDDTALIKAYDHAVQQAQKVDGELKPPKKKKSKGKKKADKLQKEKTWRWSVGNQCDAVFSEDGLIYPAVITAMLGNRKCVVRYADYGNEEEHDVKDLLKPGRGWSRQHEKTESLPSHSPARSTCSECSTSQNSATNYPPPPGQPRLPYDFDKPRSHAMPSFVPPPPPSIPGMSPCDTDEAFHSMLISWYMSGYHTGYYQGLKDGRQSGGH